MLLGQLHLKFQLHMKMPLISMKGGKAKEEGVASRNMVSSGPEEEGTSISPQFVVGAGTSFKNVCRARTLGSPPTAGGKDVGGKRSGHLNRPPLIGGSVRQCVDTPTGGGASPPPPPPYSAADMWQKGGQGDDESTQAIGVEQMAVIGELIERGTKLRDKMVQSLMGEYQAEQQ